MQERKRKILLKAISEMPQYSINGDEMWRNIENILAQQERFSTPIPNKLPVFKTPGKVWKGVENRLNEKETILKRAISEMPVYRAPGGVWGNIDLPGKRKYLRFYDFRKIAVAAILIIALGLGALLVQRQNRSGLTHADKNHASDSDKKTGSAGGLESIYNPALCAGNPEVCNSPLFKELDTQRNDLKKELTKMEPLLKQHNPQLQNYYYRLENDKAEIEKQMTRIIIES